jgi:CRISPR-associated protein Csx3
LQTAPVTLPPGDTWETDFFAVYQPDHAAASGEADLKKLEELLDPSRAPEPAPLPSVCNTGSAGQTRASAAVSVFFSQPLAGDEPSETDLAAWFPGEHRQIERDAAGNCLSFFHGAARHVVTRRKEAQVDRPTGHLLRSGRELWLDENALGSTVYASGIFNAQVYLGNTNLARGLSVVRNPLDAMASSGQRVFVRQGRANPPDPGTAHEARAPGLVDCGWRRLGIPSAFEIGLDRVRWIYQLGDTCIEAETCMDAAMPVVSLALRVLAGPPCEFLVSHLLAMGDREMDQAFSMTVDRPAARIECAPEPNTLLGGKWPQLRFVIAAQNPADVAQCGGDELLFADGKSRAAPYAVVQSKAVTEIEVRITGHRGGGSQPLTFGASGGRALPLESGRVSSGGDEFAAATGRDCRQGLPRLRHPAAAHVAEILPWFAHNACTHFTAPRGLEQYGGAAWGVRDVCQGPVEWLLATRQFAPVRHMLAQVFAQQYADSGCWPQWFMFEPFRFIQSVQAHGDVPFWPVKALCDYIEATGDFALLDEDAPYTDAQSFLSTTRRETVLQHAMRVVDVLESRRIPGTSLVNYGDGDWDDTLQPADPSRRVNMVSAWTAALAYHVFRLLHQVCLRSGHRDEADRLAALLPLMQADFQRLLLPGGVLAGFLVFGKGKPRPLLHPRDRVTGLRYRLLPMTRSMLAELLTPGQAAQHLDLIREHLLFPDGVRLMSDPVPYRGGVERWFKRAETAANFGREIGLMYTHAHLRYVEALAKLGRAKELWEMLGRVTPVQIRERVANAAPRQANAYSSSSDGAFADRYEAAARFDELRAGTVAVKGGWRIYSSGPGLYLHRVIDGMLGIRDSFGDLVLDPVLPRALDGLVAEMARDGRRIEFRYTVGERGFGVRRVCVNQQTLPLDRREANLYRDGGVRIAAAKFAALLGEGTNVVAIEVG